jgi:hypothetical protein
MRHLTPNNWGFGRRTSRTRGGAKKQKTRPRFQTRKTHCGTFTAATQQAKSRRRYARRISQTDRNITPNFSLQPSTLQRERLGRGEQLRKEDSLLLLCGFVGVSRRAAPLFIRGWGLGGVVELCDTAPPRPGAGDGCGACGGEAGCGWNDRRRDGTAAKHACRSRLRPDHPPTSAGYGEEFFPLAANGWAGVMA